MYTSTKLNVGQLYSREDLASMFGITDATLKTGIFQPKGSSSIWLFVTEQKTSDRTQYADRLDGDTLYWDGQTAGRKDQLIVDHEPQGLELLLFYRKEKYEHDRAAFRYEGAFKYVSHEGAEPTHFILRRISLALRNYWAFLANPKMYRIVDRLNETDEDYWKVGNRKVRAGDRFALWKASGGQGKRGVIALGEVLTDPEVIPDPGPTSYWLDTEGELPAPRVRVRYVRPPLAPLWLDEDPLGLLSELTVARATGGSIFNITGEQWEKLVTALGGWEEPNLEVEAPSANDKSARTIKGRGQGRQISAKERKAIERRAVDLATAHFSEQWFEVEEWGKPFDLLCIRGQEVLYVEVKGTKGRGESIILTANEVRYARERSSKMALFIVHGIETEQITDEYHAHGGEIRILKPWTVDDGELTPSQYDYVVPDC